MHTFSLFECIIDSYLYKQASLDGWLIVFLCKIINGKTSSSFCVQNTAPMPGYTFQLSWLKNGNSWQHFNSKYKEKLPNQNW